MKLVDYVLVDHRSGEIRVSGRCHDADLDAQPEAEHQVKVIGYGTPATHYYTPLGLCEYSPEQRAAKATRPPHCRWDNASMQWIDVRPLAELRAERWAIIKAARVAAIDTPIDTPWGRFDACAASRAALSVAQASSRRRWLWRAGTAPVEWTAADNSVVPLDAARLAELLRLIDHRTQQAHAQARVLRSLIDAAETAEALAAITWPQAP